MAVQTDPLQPKVHELSDAELDELLQPYQESFQGLSDEDLNALAAPYETEQLPPELAKPQIYETPTPELSTGEMLAGGARELAGGAAFEFSDEAEAAARAPFSDKSYEQLLKEIRESRARFSEAYPGAAMGLNIAGGVGTMFIPGVNVLGRTAQGLTGISKLKAPISRIAASGALAGGLSGVGAGENGWQRVGFGLTGAGLGAGLGTGFHGIGAGGRWARDFMRARGPEAGEQEAAQNAAEIMMAKLREAGLTPDQARAQLAELEQKYGIPPIMGVASPEMSKLTEIVAQTPSEERGALLQKLLQTQSKARSRVGARLREAMPTPDYFDAEENIIKTLRGNANRLYGDVADVEIRDPVILKALNNDPDIRGAYQDALANARRRQTAAELAGEDPSEYAVREIFEPVLNEAGDLVGLSSTGKAIPDIRTLDQIKQALDRRINSLYKNGQGGDAEDLRAIRDKFVERLDKVGPAGYKAARQQYKGDIEVREALELGRKAGSLEWQQIRKNVGKYSPGELQAFKTGYMQHLMERMQRSAQDRNVANSILNSPSELNKLEALTDPAEFAVLKAALERESALFKNIQQATTGSATFGREEGRKAIEEQIAGGNVEDAVAMLLNPTPGNIVQRAMSLTRRLKNANVSRATYTQLARMLRAASPDEVEAVFQRLEAAAPAEAAAARASERRATKLAAGTARTMAPSPEVGGFRETEDVEYKPVTLPDETGASVSPPVASPEGTSTAFANAPEGEAGGATLGQTLEKLFPGYEGVFKSGIVTPQGGVSAADLEKALGLPPGGWEQVFMGR